MAATAMMSLAPSVRAQGGEQDRAQGRVQGVVFDSIASRPLDSAFVQMAYYSDPTLSRSVTTDRRGRFTVDSLRAGAWIVSLMHPRIDSAGVTQLVQRVLVSPGGNTRVQMALPAAASITRRVCGDTVARDSSGFVHGVLSDARQQRAPVRGRVTFEWVDAMLTVGSTREGVGYTRTPVGLEVASDSTGRFVACGIPLGGTIRVRGMTADDSTGVLELRVPSSGIARMDLTIGPSRLVTLSSPTGMQRVDVMMPDGMSAGDSLAADSVLGPVVVRRGDGELSGTVRARDGSPLVGAIMSVPGTGVVARTDAAGSFRLRDLPAGTHVVEARAIGFVASRDIVDIAADAPTPHTVLLDRLASLDTVRVQATRITLYDPRLIAFEKRRVSGLGLYRGPRQLAEMRPFRISDILRTMSGIRIVYGSGRDLIRMRTVQDYCTPEVFVDGMRMFTDDGDLDRLLYVEDVRAVEVYSPMLPTPPEFLVAGNLCGVIAFLTGSRN